LYLLFAFGLKGGVGKGESSRSGLPSESDLLIEFFCLFGFFQAKGWCSGRNEEIKTALGEGSAGRKKKRKYFFER